MREILVTGGNGFVGRHVVAALQDRGDHVRVLALPAEDTRWLRDRGVAVYRGDVRDARALIGPMRGVDGVLHLAAMMDVWRPIAEYRAVNVTGTANVCHAAVAAGVERLVHMSSSSVYGIARGRSVDESFPLRPFPDPYAQTKAEGDLVVQRLIARAQLPAVVLRPDQIFGPGDTMHFGRIAERLLAGRGIIVGSGKNALPLVYVSDAVQGLLLALDREQAIGQAYNISASRPLTQQQFLQCIADELGVRPPGLHIPYRVLNGVAQVAEWIVPAVPTCARPPLTRLGVGFFGTDNRYLNDKARRELGYLPHVDLVDGVRATVRWLQRRDPMARAPAARPGDPQPATAVHAP